MPRLDCSSASAETLNGWRWLEFGVYRARASCERPELPEKPHESEVGRGSGVESHPAGPLACVLGPPKGAMNVLVVRM